MVVIIGSYFFQESGFAAVLALHNYADDPPGAYIHFCLDSSIHFMVYIYIVDRSALINDAIQLILGLVIRMMAFEYAY